MTPLQKLHGRIAACMDCPLGQPESETFHRVPGEGPEDARVMIVGEAPGAKEDETGIHLVFGLGTKPVMSAFFAEEEGAVGGVVVEEVFGEDFAGRVAVW